MVHTKENLKLKYICIRFLHLDIYLLLAPEYLHFVSFVYSPPILSKEIVIRKAWILSPHKIL